MNFNFRDRHCRSSIQQEYTGRSFSRCSSAPPPTLASPRSLAELHSEDTQQKFRQLPCRTFISVGTCPYRERCVYLHDPRLQSRDARTKTRKKNKEDIVQDSLFWPVLAADIVAQKLDCNRQPHVIQRYNVPAPQPDQPQFRRHDQAVFSMWNHFCTTIGLLAETEYRFDEDTLTFMTPEHVARFPPRPASPVRLSCYDPVRRVFTPQSCPEEDQDHTPPALQALRNNEVTTNAFVRARRLDAFVKLSQGVSLATTPQTPAGRRSAPLQVVQSAHVGSMHTERDARQPFGVQRFSPPTVRVTPARRGMGVRPPTDMDVRGSGCFGFPPPHTSASMPAPPVAKAGLPAPASFPASPNGYQCLGDLVNVPSGSGSKILRPQAWSPPRGKPLWSAAASLAAATNEADDVDAEIAMICGLLQGPERGSGAALATPPATPERAVFRRQAPTPIAQAATGTSDPSLPPSLAHVASPTTVAEPFRAGLSPVHAWGAVWDKAGKPTDACDAGSELDGRAEAYRQTVLALNSQYAGVPDEGSLHGGKGSDGHMHSGAVVGLPGVCRSLF